VAPTIERARATKDSEVLREVMQALATHPSYAALLRVLDVWNG